LGFFVFLLPSAVWAQTETGQIIGTVTDPQGAVVRAATVTIKSVETGATRPATTNEQGQYVVANLQPGLYDVTVQAQGFAPKTQRVQVTVGSQVSLETSLSIQAAEAVVDVVASGGVEVNTQNQELSDVVSGTQIRELPTLTRNPYDLVGLSGNVSEGDPSGRGTGFSINGQRAASTNILLDGAENVDAFRATVGQTVPLDSVQEFRVVTSNFSAEYGRATGGIVNVGTRAGSNDFHGSLYEFYRGAGLSTNSFDNNANRIPKGNFVRNQFGYAAGGRIIPEKLFFFSGTEWIRVRSRENQQVLVPTPELLALSSAATRNFFSAFPLATPINGRIFSVGEVSTLLDLPAGNAFSALPASTPAFGQVNFSVPGDVGGGFPQNTWATNNRIDWNISEKTQIYGRFAFEDNDIFPGTVSFSPFQGFNTGTTNFNQNHLVSLTHAFSPKLVSQTKLVYNRLNNQVPLGEQPAGPTLFVRSLITRISGFRVALPGYLPFSPGSAIPFGGPQNLGQLYQDVNWTLGNHQLRFGGTYIYIQDNRTFGAYQNAVETLGRNVTEGLSNLVAGQLRSFAAAIDPQGRFPGEAITLPVTQPQFSRSNRYHEFAFYVNDNWRLRPNLTLNLGLRYDYFGVQHNNDERLDSNFYFGQGSNFFEQIRNGRVFIAEDSPVGGLWEPDRNNFAPRVGVAWDITGDGKTSLRGGYGISYERNFGNVTFNVIQNPPNYAVIALTSGVDIPTIPITTNNFGPLSGSGVTVTLPPTSLRHVREDIETAFAHLWSLAVEREIFPNTVASIQYTGSAGRNLYTLENINRPGSGAVFFGDASPTARLNRQFTDINTRGKAGFSNYNALIAELVNSGWRKYGLQFTARYQYGIALDNLSSTFSESANNFNLGLLDPFDPDLDYGFADFDIRHRFVTGFNWEIPWGRNSSSWAARLLGGWELTGIFTARTGLPFSIFDCSNALQVCPRLIEQTRVDRSARSGSDLTPDAVTPNRFVYIDLAGQASNYINPITRTSDFGPFPGNLTGRNAFRGPGLWNLDGGIYKRFYISENKYFQLRGEFYNLFNHPNLFIRGAEAEITTSPFVPAFFDGRRNIQLALKFVF
jgi:outer membrane receptor protein involved in Fe transport